MYQLLKEQFAETFAALGRIVFNQGNPNHRLIMALYATILEYVDSAIFLMDAGKSAGVQGIQRSCLEAYIDLQNLANDATYADQMEAHYHEQWRLVCKDAVGGTNLFLQTLKAEATVRMQEHIGALAKLPNPMSVKQRFDLSGLGDLYYSVYNGLCAETHNNLRALIDRHFRRVGTPEKPAFEIMAFDGMDHVSFDAAVDIFITIVAEANRIVHDYFDTGELDTLEQFQKRRIALAKTFSAAT